jgi:DNA-binding response OmpR family regulator
MNRFIMDGRPRLLLIYSDSAHASRCGRYFRRLGWEVRTMPGGCEARQALIGFQPTYVVVDADLPDESGWLTCAKILLTPINARIILQVPSQGDQNFRFAHFLNVDGVVTRADGVEALAERIVERDIAPVVA